MTESTPWDRIDSLRLNRLLVTELILVQLPPTTLEKLVSLESMNSSVHSGTESLFLILCAKCMLSAQDSGSFHRCTVTLTSYKASLLLYSFCKKNTHCVHPHKQTRQSSCAGFTDWEKKKNTIYASSMLLNRMK